MSGSNTAAIIVAVFAVLMTTSVWFLGIGEEQPGQKKAKAYHMKVHYIDAFQLYDVIKLPKEPMFMGEANDNHVTWALFFFKPYCGACRRVRPVLESLAGLVEDTHKLRFAAIDCVKYRVFCEKEKVDKHPRIVLYSTRGGRDRYQTAAWSGMLMAWEVFTWFKQMQYQSKIHKSIIWPTDTEVAEGLLNFKKKGLTQVDHVINDIATLNRTAYLVDIKFALHQGLVDSVFKGKSELSGSRLRVMLKWLEVVNRAYPEQETRDRIMLLHDTLKLKKSWPIDDYEAAVKEWGGIEVTDNDWEFCKIKGPGIGGYPCGLWTLFHVLQANTNRQQAADTLKTIQAWITMFFGCTECAQHFNAMWIQDKGDDQKSDIDCALWLWHAHNKVRARLYKEDDTTTGKTQWPEVEQCEECFDEKARNGTASYQLTTTDYHKEQWREGFVFQYVQEIYCYQSDLLPCASFWDPSDDGKEKDYTWQYIGIGTLCIIVLALTGWFVCYDAHGDDDDENEALKAALRAEAAGMGLGRYDEGDTSHDDDEGDDHEGDDHEGDEGDHDGDQSEDDDGDK